MTTARRGRTPRIPVGAVGAGPGEAVRGLEALGRRYTAAIRVLTLIPTVAVALVAGAEASMTGTVAAAFLVVVAWSGVYVWQVRSRNPPLLPIADVAVLGALALATPWIVPPSWLFSGKSWLLPFLSFAGVAYQYSCPRWRGIGCALALAAAATVGTARALPTGSSASTLVTAVWSGVVAGLAMLLWGLVRRGGTMADAARADLEAAEQERRVASALRQDQQALSTALHDTAASTLLMVGIGAESIDGAKLAAQARRDLEVLGAFGTEHPRRLDLRAALEAVATVASVAVGIDGPDELWLPADITHALAGATTEALNNVAKHAGTTVAEMTVSGGPHAVVVTVVDHGNGFDTAPAGSCIDIGADRTTRRGVRDSMHGRMSTVGGGCRITSARGAGTTVRLEWAHAPERV